MKRFVYRSGVVAGAATAFLASQAHAAIGLSFTDNDTTPTSANVSPGSNFPFSVKLTESSTSDRIVGVDYQISASQNGVFEFLSRNSNPSGSQFTFANGKSDAQLSAVILNPSNGTDLGTSTTSGNPVPGVATYELSDFIFEVLPGTPAGIYTLTFSSTSYADNTSTPGSFSTPGNTLGTFTVSVPEPISIGALVCAGGALSLRRRKQINK